MEQIIPVINGDNYIYLIAKKGRALIVDPGEAAPVIRELHRLRLQPAAVLITHCHGDHTGGISALMEHFPELQIYAPSGCCTETEGELYEGRAIRELGMDIAVIHTPGHTADSFCFHLGGDLFTGDTLFGSGCGRIFSGDGAALFRSLRKIAALPEGTRLWYGHEYTMDNLEFALHVDPANQEYGERVDRLRTAGGCSIPGTVGEELRANPFLQTASKRMWSILKKKGAPVMEPLDLFLYLRRWKDRY